MIEQGLTSLTIHLLIFQFNLKDCLNNYVYLSKWIWVSTQYYSQFNVINFCGLECNKRCFPEAFWY